MPRAVRRRFSRLASVLELADDEFVATRQEIDYHQADAKKKIKQGGLGIEIDLDSLSAFVQSSLQTEKLDREIARHRNATVQKRLDGQFLGRVAGQLRELGFSSVQDLSSHLDEYRELLPKFVQHWLRLTNQVRRISLPPLVPVPIGITLYYAGALRCSQALAAGLVGGSAYSENDPDLLRRALRDTSADTPEGYGR